MAHRATSASVAARTSASCAHRRACDGTAMSSTSAALQVGAHAGSDDRPEGSPRRSAPDGRERASAPRTPRARGARAAESGSANEAEARSRKSARATAPSRRRSARHRARRATTLSTDRVEVCHPPALSTAVPQVSRRARNRQAAVHEHRGEENARPDGPGGRAARAATGGHHRARHRRLPASASRIAARSASPSERPAARREPLRRMTSSLRAVAACAATASASWARAGTR